MESVPRELFRQFYEEAIPFNRMLGLKLEYWEKDAARMRLPYRDELIGDFLRGAIHGGVVATLIDVAGGAAISAHISYRDRISTVDLRVDYLRKAEPRDLVASAKVVRVGKRLATVRMDVYHDGEDVDPVAIGSGVYSIKRGETPA